MSSSIRDSKDTSTVIPATTSSTMMAARYHQGNKNLVLETITTPQPSFGEVLLKVEATGMCHSDLHVLEGEFPIPGSFTMGHEVAGTAVVLGPGVTEIIAGDLYVVHAVNPCGECFYCRRGQDNLCDSPTRNWIGLGSDGGYAEYILVRTRNLIKVPSGITPAVAAIASDAILTSYHALKTLGKIQSGQTVLHIGMGALGLNGVEISKILGAQAIATNRSLTRLQLAREMGADEIYPLGEVEEALKGRTIDIVADYVCSEQTIMLAQTLVRPGGKVLLIGLASMQSPLMNSRVIPLEIEVQGSFWGTSWELREVLQLIVEGKLSPLVETFPLSQINSCLDKLRQSQVGGRIAIVPNLTS
jgi:propanol-preferring alcohol dehydrogenase